MTPSLCFATSAVNPPNLGTFAGTTASESVSCQTATACSGSIGIYTVVANAAAVAKSPRPGRLLARGTYKIKPHSKGTVRLKLNAAGRKATRRVRRITVVQVITQRLPHGRRTTVTRTISLRRH